MRGVFAVPEGRSLPGIGDLIADRYRIERVLGRGGMGVAYAATNVVTGKQLALKWILREGNATQLQRVIREARAAGRIHHPNIVDVYDVGEHQGSLFLVMELLHGQSLQARLDERGRLDPAELLQWLLPALRGVREAHRRGVIHRDLKPANVFLSFDEAGEPLTAKVLDFGVSKIIAPETGSEDPSLTDSGAVVGTPSYTAPEQLERADRADRRSDVYACGALLYHALSGKRPFEAESYAQLVVKIMTSQPAPLEHARPELPHELCEVIARAMRRNPEQRFADMDALIQALEAFTPQTLAEGASAPRVLATGSRTTGRARMFGAIALVLLLACAGVWLGGQGHRASAETPAASTVAALPEARPEPERTHTPPAQPIPPVVAEGGPATPANEPSPRARRSRRARAASTEPALPAQAVRAPAPAPAPPEAIIELSAEDF